MELDGLDKQFERLLKEFPEARKKLIVRNGDKLYRKVIANIEAAVDEKSGDLKKGVVEVQGSGGGYVAVRCNHLRAPHMHLIENGHKVVRNGKVVGWVSGKHMYRNAINELADELERSGEEMINNLVGEIFG